MDVLLISCNLAKAFSARCNVPRGRELYMVCTFFVAIMSTSLSHGQDSSAQQPAQVRGSNFNSESTLNSYCLSQESSSDAHEILCLVANRDIEKLASTIRQVDRSSAVWKEVVGKLRESRLPTMPDSAYAVALDTLARHILNPDAWARLKLLQGRYHEVVVGNDREAIRHMEKVFKYGSSPSVIPEARDRIWRLRQLEGRRLPMWSAETYRGATFDVADYVGERPVVVYLWAIYCSACYDTVKKITALSKRFGESAKFVGLMADSREDERYKELVRFVDQYAPWPQVLAKNKTYNGLSLFEIYHHSDYGPSYPLGHIVLIDVNGTVKISGMSDEVLPYIIERLEEVAGR